MENPGLYNLIQKLIRQGDQISIERKLKLEQLGQNINLLLQRNGKLDIVVICTHNSRRSQLGEAWLHTACQYYKITGIKTFSGGTVATAFNIRMAVAMRQSSFRLRTEQPADNPRYLLTALRSSGDPYYMYSKKYDDDFNPQTGFMAIMVCSDADQNCPTVFGASERHALPYNDPKELDDTPMEHEAYLEKVEEMGREVLYMMGQVNLIMNN